MNYPRVDPKDVQGFAKAWDCNGLKMILDQVSLKFAVDFANVVLKSYVDNLAMKALAIKAAREKIAQEGDSAPPPVDAVATQRIVPEAPCKSSIILTDV